MSGSDAGGAPAPSPRERGASRREWLRSIAAALLLFAVLRTFVVQVYGITTPSMEGTLRVGDYVVAHNAVFGAAIPFTRLRTPALRSPRHGEVVVYRPEYNDPRTDVIKRVIGLPGDTVRMVERVVYRNGVRVDEPYVEPVYTSDRPMPARGPQNYAWHRLALPAGTDADAYQPTRDNWGPLVVPEGHYLLLGDNRDESVDSRYMGFTPRSEIRSKVSLIHFSAAPGRGSRFLGSLARARWGRIGTLVH